MELVWDEVGARRYETGVDHGVLYIPNEAGVYDDGVAWNGLTSISEAPSGAESNYQYADNIVYLNLIAVELFGATIEAFTYPDEFAQFDGLSSPSPGVMIGQQARKSFGLCYRTRIGNDLEGDALGYKLHLVYGCFAAPSEKAYATVNDSPEAITFSWSVTTVPVAVPNLRPTSAITIDSTQVDSDALAALEQILYGDTGVDPALPLPAAVIALFDGTFTVATPTQPAFNGATETITIPSVTGVVYNIDGVPVAAGPVVITEDTIVTATPADGYVFAPGVDDDWFYDYTP